MKLMVNHIRTGIKSADGKSTWGEALVSVLGAKPADKVVLRASEDTLMAMAQVMASAKAAGQALTVECDSFVEAEVKGVTGVREESFVTKEGQAVTQTALYLKLGANPVFAKEVIREDTGNLAALLGDTKAIFDTEDFA